VLRSVMVITATLSDASALVVNESNPPPDNFDAFPTSLGLLYYQRSSPGIRSIRAPTKPNQENGNRERPDVVDKWKTQSVEQWKVLICGVAEIEGLGTFLMKGLRRTHTHSIPPTGSEQKIQREYNDSVPFALQVMLDKYTKRRRARS
jgi:hypothetical protein